jgi:hypothetical protein
LGSVTWSQFFFWFFETYCEHAPCNKVCGSTNFIIFGPTYQKLWMFKNFKRSPGMVGMCSSQLARVDYINLKRWATWIRRFKKSALRVSSPVFEPCPYTWKGEIFHSSCSLEISFLSKKVFAKIRVYQDLHIHRWDFCLLK